MHQVFQSLPLVPLSLRPFFYGMALLALAIFLLGALERVWLWRRGKERPDGVLAGMSLSKFLLLGLAKTFSPDCLFARRTFARSHGRGAMLMGIVWGSLILIAGVLVSALVYFAPAPFLNLDATRALAFLMDLGGGMLMLGLLAGIVRRYWFHPEHWLTTPGDGFMLILFEIVVVLGFLMEGARLAGTGWQFATWYPIGSASGVLLAAIAPGREALLAFYPTLYLLHAGAAFTLFAYLPFSRLFHVFAAQITTFAARLELEQLKNENTRRFQIQR